MDQVREATSFDCAALIPRVRTRQMRRAALALAAKVRYRIDPQNPYPKNFTGHIRATLRDGSVVEEHQPYIRGGAQEPLARADIQDKFLLNVVHGGWSADRAARVLATIGTLFDGPVELKTLRG